MKGCDFSGWRPGASWLKRNGFGFVVRYLKQGGPAANDYAIDKDELAEYRDAGLEVVLNFEQHERDMAGGYAQGQGNAREALRWAQSLGVWPCVIYFSCDTDPALIGREAVVAYLEGCGSVLGGPEFVGVYGGHDAVAWGLESGAALWLWQTFAWSGGRWYDKAHLRQVATPEGAARGYQPTGGDFDVNESLVDNFGQVGGGPAVKPRPFAIEEDEVRFREFHAPNGHTYQYLLYEDGAVVCYDMDENGKYVGHSNPKGSYKAITRVLDGIMDGAGEDRVIWETYWDPNAGDWAQPRHAY